jgi:hypothetical protein
VLAAQFYKVLLKKKRAHFKYIDIKKHESNAWTIYCDNSITK